jgi:hypothetical protein
LKIREIRDDFRKMVRVEASKEIPGEGREKMGENKRDVRRSSHPSNNSLGVASRGLVSRGVAGLIRAWRDVT